LYKYYFIIKFAGRQFLAHTPITMDSVNQFPDFRKYDFKLDRRYLAIIGEFQTGDIMHVAGALALHDNIDVLVLYDNLAKKDKSVKAIVDLYTGVEPKRLRHVTPFYHEAARNLYKLLKKADDLLKVDVDAIKAELVGTTSEDAASLIVSYNPSYFQGSSNALHRY
jgi:hypothetical protein